MLVNMKSKDHSDCCFCVTLSEVEGNQSRYIKGYCPCPPKPISSKECCLQTRLATQTHFLFGFKCIKELHSKSLHDHKLLIILEKNVIWGFTEINLFRFPLY